VVQETWVRISPFLVTSLVPLLFPIDLVIGGIALVLPPPVNNWLVPLCSALVGLIVSVLTAYGSPEGAGWQSFVIGSWLTSYWLILLAFVTGQAVRQAWLRIASPIIGSWLAAAGLLLGATLAISKPPPTPGIAVHPPAEIRDLPQP
jgi:hydrogenase/urease accessory protein HupE